MRIRQIYLKPLLFSLSLIIIESLVHLLIALIIRFSKYGWNEIYKVSEYTGTSQFENIFFGVLSILILRLMLELPVRILVEYSELKNVLFKASIYLITVIAYSVSFSYRLGFSFDKETFMDTQSGWIIHLPLSVLIVWTILTMNYLIKHK